MTCLAVVVAAGRGTRFGGDIPKAYALIQNTALLRRTLEHLLAIPEIDNILVVIHADDYGRYSDCVAGLGNRVLEPVLGGETRQDSVLNGLKAAELYSPNEVLIHDAARPFLSAVVVKRLLGALKQSPGAIPALAVRDSLVKTSASGEIEAVSRDGVWSVQTPQAFHYKSILDAHQKIRDNHYTDDASVFQAAGYSVTIVDGDSRLLKITTREDVTMAEALIQSQQASSVVPDMRVGTGYDVHRLLPKSQLNNKPLIICGVTIPFDFALEGHSDADVGLHAIVDAILGHWEWGISANIFRLRIRNGKTPIHVYLWIMQKNVAWKETLSFKI
ncbi:MAG: 2-C-methyl-D-erythritol 4-phosphate cytidylyltransferase [Alphaproteobacteria bacterium]|nr:2-C-methyl-D-erythritol 4-phosphate cytidylyltransferase [Alphaproteobacteria bacterium]